MIFVEQQMDGRWLVYNEHVAFGAGESRHAALIRARSVRPDAMRCVPLQPEEIPGELREIARRMRAVSGPLIYFGGFGARGDLGRSLEAMGRWADSVAEWAGNLEDCADGPRVEADREEEKCA